MDFGNPGEKYRKTRHNTGFMVIDKLAQKLDAEGEKKKFKGITRECMVGGQKVLLLKPETYMNLSGESVIEAINFYKLPFENLIVIYDDADIEFGKIRIKPEGSSGTHNGMRSIADTLDTHDFSRIRVGIGKPENEMDLADYVLATFNEEEENLLEDILERAAEAVIEIVRNGIDKAMNEYN